MERKVKTYVLQHAITYFKDESLSLDNVRTVWQCKTLKNWKGIFIIQTQPVNHLLYEVTYNGNTQEYYIDVYNKIDNIVHQIIDLPHTC